MAAVRSSKIDVIKKYALEVALTFGQGKGTWRDIDALIKDAKSIEAYLKGECGENRR